MRGVRGWGLEGGMVGVLWVVVSGYGFPFRMVVLVVGLLNP